MKTLVFDAGPVISLDVTGLLWAIEPLRKKFSGKFYITSSVKRELVDRPFEIKKYKFEAIQVQKLIEDGIFEIVSEDFIRNDTNKLFNAANHVFQAHDNFISIVHFAEMSVVAAAISMNSDAVVIDEKTTRLLIESPEALANVLRKTLHTAIKVDKDALEEFGSMTRKIRIIRSSEIAAMIYELGLLDKFLTRIPDAGKNLLESVLWGVKLNGCAVSREEIEDILKMELRYRELR